MPKASKQQVLEQTESKAFEEWKQSGYRRRRASRLIGL